MAEGEACRALVAAVASWSLFCVWVSASSASDELVPATVSGLGSRTTAPLLRELAGAVDADRGHSHSLLTRTMRDAADRIVAAEEALRDTYWLLRQGEPDNALHALDAWIIKNGHGDWLAAVPEENQEVNDGEELEEPTAGAGSAA